MNYTKIKADFTFHVKAIVMFDLPPDKEMMDKFVFGVYKGNDFLIAVMDVIKDYRTPRRMDDRPVDD